MKTLWIVLIPTLALVTSSRFSENKSSTTSDVSSTTVGKADSLREGDSATMFVLRDIKTDEPIYLRDYTGKILRERSKNKEHQVVVLSFWSTWCEPCKIEIPRLTKLAGEFRGKPVQFFLINTMEERSTTEDSIRAVYESRGYTLPCLVDATRRVAVRYTVHALPMIVIIDKEGTVRKVLRGFHEDSYQEFSELLKRLVEQDQSQSK